MKFTKSIPLKGELRVPGDKSISHRGVMLGSLAQGTTAVTNFLEGADCLSTINCFRLVWELIFPGQKKKSSFTERGCMVCLLLLPVWT